MNCVLYPTISNMRKRHTFYLQYNVYSSNHIRCTVPHVYVSRVVPNVIGINGKVLFYIIIIIIATAPRCWFDLSRNICLGFALYFRKCNNSAIRRMIDFIRWNLGCYIITDVMEHFSFCWIPLAFDSSNYSYDS